MKQAYVSLLLPFPRSLPNPIQLSLIDELLNRLCRNHEIIVVTPFEFSEDEFKLSKLHGPLSIVYTNSIHSSDRARISALGRVVGDFVVEWQGELESLSLQILENIFKEINSGIELVEIATTHQSRSSRFFYKVVNLLRPSRLPVHKYVSRTMSRRSIGQLLAAAKIEQQINILYAELPVKRKRLSADVNFMFKSNLRQRAAEGASLLARGSRFGTVIPLTLATVSAMFGFFVALYAGFIYLLSGKSPEGWTTLMIVLGIGQGSILALIGMTWSRIDSLTKGMSQVYDVTAEVLVISPTD